MITKHLGVISLRGLRTSAVNIPLHTCGLCIGGFEAATLQKFFMEIVHLKYRHGVIF